MRNAPSRRYWTTSRRQDARKNSEPKVLLYCCYNIIYLFPRPKITDVYETTSRYLCRCIDPFINLNITFYVGPIADPAAATTAAGEEPTGLNVLATM